MSVPEWGTASLSSELHDLRAYFGNGLKILAGDGVLDLLVALTEQLSKLLDLSGVPLFVLLPPPPYVLLHCLQLGLVLPSERLLLLSECPPLLVGDLLDLGFLELVLQVKLLQLLLLGG